MNPNLDNLKNTENLKEHLLHILSHDIYSPLRFCTMVGKAVLLQQNNLSKEEVLDALNDINLTNTRTLLLISNILKLVEFEKGNYIPHLSNENLHTILQDKIDFFGLMAQAKKIELTNLIPQSIYINTDKTVLGIIFQNLLNNAVKFTENGSIIVSAVTDNASVTVSIADSGKGIPTDLIDAITNTDCVMPLPDTDNMKGSGLGWSLIKTLLQQINGSFKIISTINAGTTILIKLPV